MNRGAALSGALLVTLETPPTWPMALAAFLLRGGLPLVVLPIVVLPSSVGLGNLLLPTVMTVVFQGPSVELAVVVGLVLLATVGWIAAGGLVAATLEAEMTRIVARPGEADESRRRESAPSSMPWAVLVATRILAVRVLAHLPTGLAVTWGSARLVTIAYRELTSPFDVTSPIVLRVLRGAPEVIGVTVVAWMLGEIVGGIAAHRVVLGGSGVTRAMREAVAAVARHPLGVLVGFWVPTAGLALIVVPSVVAAAAAWGAVRVAMRSPGDPVAATLGVVLFVTLWLIGLALIAVAAAWRGAVWSIVDQEYWARPAGAKETEPG